MKKICKRKIRKTKGNRKEKGGKQRETNSIIYIAPYEEEKRKGRKRRDDEDREEREMMKMRKENAGEKKKR